MNNLQVISSLPYNNNYLSIHPTPNTYDNLLVMEHFLSDISYSKSGADKSDPNYPTTCLQFVREMKTMMTSVKYI